MFAFIISLSGCRTPPVKTGSALLTWLCGIWMIALVSHKRSHTLVVLQNVHIVRIINQLKILPQSFPSFTPIIPWVAIHKHQGIRRFQRIST
ncbi:hypothetical protein BDN72DRAFT_489183 [Pluteus cervinus]|uniref:Uncharacterized protein n=1 Tax=Pluteus cervinus TaxID=181527 RepID=A0ACD3A813_9AGAR|nr:hypothetical protein BDN72DRAFT_489183 [Pluteus cervinus]